MELRGATVLVTGGSSGIGRAIAKTLSGAGADVAITGRDEKRLKEAADALKVLPVRGDVSNEADVRRTYEEVLKAFGHLDVLVNNAGKGVFKPLIDMQQVGVRRRAGDQHDRRNADGP
jgi:3-oxoacyl-[acyl-carrier protein] reductase